jgi:hypothetical protein
MFHLLHEKLAMFRDTDCLVVRIYLSAHRNSAIRIQKNVAQFPAREKCGDGLSPFGRIFRGED